MSSTTINEELGISVSSHFDSGNADVRALVAPLLDPCYLHR